MSGVPPFDTKPEDLKVGDRVRVYYANEPESYRLGTVTYIPVSSNGFGIQPHVRVWYDLGDVDWNVRLASAVKTDEPMPHREATRMLFGRLNTAAAHTDDPILRNVCYAIRDWVLAGGVK